MRALLEFYERHYFITLIYRLFSYNYSYDWLKFTKRNSPMTTKFAASAIESFAIKLFERRD